jgi:hypothetical protein
MRAGYVGTTGNIGYNYLYCCGIETQEVHVHVGHSMFLSKKVK